MKSITAISDHISRKVDLKDNLTLLGATLTDPFVRHDYDAEDEIMTEISRRLRTTVKALKYTRKNVARLATKYWPNVFRKNRRIVEVFLLLEGPIRYPGMDEYYHAFDRMQAESEVPMVHPSEQEVAVPAIVAQLQQHLRDVDQVRTIVLGTWAATNDSTSHQIAQATKQARGILKLIKKRRVLRIRCGHEAHKVAKLEGDTRASAQLDEANLRLLRHNQDLKNVTHKLHATVPHILALLDEFVEAITTLVLSRQTDSVRSVKSMLAAFGQHHGIENQAYDEIVSSWESAVEPAIESIEAFVHARNKLDLAAVVNHIPKIDLAYFTKRKLKVKAENVFWDAADPIKALEKYKGEKSEKSERNERNERNEKNEKNLNDLNENKNDLNEKNLNDLNKNNLSENLNELNEENLNELNEKNLSENLNENLNELNDSNNPHAAADTVDSGPSPPKPLPASPTNGHVSPNALSPASAPPASTRPLSMVPPGTRPVSMAPPLPTGPRPAPPLPTGPRPNIAPPLPTGPRPTAPPLPTGPRPNLKTLPPTPIDFDDMSVDSDFSEDTADTESVSDVSTLDSEIIAASTPDTVDEKVRQLYISAKDDIRTAPIPQLNSKYNVGLANLATDSTTYKLEQLNRLFEHIVSRGGDTEIRTAKYSFVAERVGDLPLVAGQPIEVLLDFQRVPCLYERGGWVVGCSESGRMGFVPRDYLE